MSEARDALAVALRTRYGTHIANGTLDDLAAQLLAALPDGWVLARREDAEDGAALRELREALGDTDGLGLFLTRTGVVQASVAAIPARQSAVGDSIKKAAEAVLRSLRANRMLDDLLAAAARKAKDALGGGS